MADTQAVYRLRKFTASADEGFASALRIYSQAMPPSLKTNTNEIAYWLDNYAKQFDDRLLLYGFYVDEELAGYAELAWFQDERLLVVDYLVIDPKHRKNNVFFEFSEHLRKSILSEGLDIDFVVAEVGLQQESSHASDYSRALIRLLRFMGLGQIKAPYFQPQLGMSNAESRIRAALMVGTVGFAPLRRLQKKTFLRIVETIYYKHYARWYSIYRDQMPAYRAQLDDLCKAIELETAASEAVEIDGSSEAMEWSEPPPSNPMANQFKIAYLTMFMFLALTAGLLSLKHFLHTNTIALVLVFIASLVSFFAVMSLFSKESRRVLKLLLGFMLSFRKSK